MTVSTRRLVDYRVRNGVARLELGNPPVNSCTHEMMRDLDDAVLHARFEDGVHVLVIGGAGEEAFCAGADLNMLNAVTPSFRYHFFLHAQETLSRLEHTPKLVIAALNGSARGAGLAIAMAADLRIALDDAARPAEHRATFGLDEVATGLLPGMGGTRRLARLVGQARAMELMTTGELLTAARAHEIGLVNHVWAAMGAGEFAERVQRYAEGFCPPRRAAHAIGLIKRALHGRSEAGPDEAEALERELLQRLFDGPDAREGLRAALAGRAADFTGR